MRLNRLLSAILACIIICSLTACGKDEESSLDSESTDTEVVESTSNSENATSNSENATSNENETTTKNQTTVNSNSTTNKSSGESLGFIVINSDGDLEFYSSDEKLADLNSGASNLIYDTPDGRDITDLRLEEDTLYIESCYKTGGTKSMITKMTYPFNNTYIVYKTKHLLYGVGNIPVYENIFYYADSGQELKAYNIETKEEKVLKKFEDTYKVSNSNLILDDKNGRIYYMTINDTTGTAAICYYDIANNNEVVVINDLKRGYSICNKGSVIYYAADFIDDTMTRKFGIFSLDVTVEDIEEAEKLVCIINTASKSFKSITMTSDDSTVYFINGNKIEKSVNSGESSVVYTPEDGVILQRLMINSDNTLYVICYDDNTNRVVYKLTDNGDSLSAEEASSDYRFEMIEIFENKE